MTHLPVELGFTIGANTGWGLFGAHLALGLARQGRNVYLPPSDVSGFPATLRRDLNAMMEPKDTSERRIRFDTWGNHCPEFQPVPNRYRVLLAVFEDSEAVVPETMNQYDLVLAPSRWVQSLLSAKGVESTLWHQGYDESLFCPAPRRRPSSGPFMIFSGGKLEFRKGQDIVVEAFRRFRETPEGKDSILVTAWQNQWPRTMEGIWESGYVRGVPVQRGPTLDIVSWLEANGLPRESVIDLGLLSQAEMANAIRECDVGLFPNRAEGATNMALCEALGAGLPCIVGGWTGQADIGPSHGTMTIGGNAYPPVTLPCKLYRGMDGWREPDPEDFARMLFRTTKYELIPEMVKPMAPVFGWSARTAELHDILMQEVE